VSFLDFTDFVISALDYQFSKKNVEGEDGKMTHKLPKYISEIMRVYGVTLGIAAVLTVRLSIYVQLINFIKQGGLQQALGMIRGL